MASLGTLICRQPGSLVFMHLWFRYSGSFAALPALVPANFECAIDEKITPHESNRQQPRFEQMGDRKTAKRRARLRQLAGNNMGSTDAESPTVQKTLRQVHKRSASTFAASTARTNPTARANPTARTNPTTRTSPLVLPPLTPAQLATHREILAEAERRRERIKYLLAQLEEMDRQTVARKEVLARIERGEVEVIEIVDD
ncbi:hypothetical protein EDC01DRAFT_629724 [Geopyxis carbonaria]|nr:hypothetical protein EDC01DRAFT_629724 [Geopyxis carbonaria]